MNVISSVDLVGDVVIDNSPKVEMLCRMVVLLVAVDFGFLTIVTVGRIHHLVLVTLANLVTEFIEEKP